MIVHDFGKKNFDENKTLNKTRNKMWYRMSLVHIPLLHAVLHSQDVTSFMPHFWRRSRF
jgi:hypothetical protein